MASTSAKQEIRIKLLVDNSSRKVLFAEAGKDFIDFLFGLLELPLGSILALLFQNGVSGSGSLGKIYESVKNLDDDYLVSNQIREFLMRPRIADVAPASNTKNTLLKQFPKQESYNPNPSQHQNFSFQSPRFGRSSGFAPPPSTFSFAFATSSSPFSSASAFYSSSLGSSTTVVAAPGAPAAPVVVEGYVKGLVTYMVMDDLLVKPMSNISGISILSSMKVQNLGSVEEKTVEVDLDMGLKLLKASFESSTVLTDVFLPTTCFSSYEN
ncbi:hypothetical protein Vadar_015354 [Vaccinium darrowii]|uniref:Uncharacterized protein n=1 Tax=Vaccinium darrowii TaxID=229202 RepID=A0ACB7X9Z6_9ERIC|nr:hypothetical protein Vadar_015354 [Vaccinium darrowii]